MPLHFSSPPCCHVGGFRLRPSSSSSSPLAQRATGQYVGLRVTLPSGDKIERDYSLSDSPGPSDNNSKPTYYRITMKKIPGGVCSNYFHERVEEGTQIEVSHSRPFSLNKKS